MTIPAPGISVCPEAIPREGRVRVGPGETLSSVWQRAAVLGSLWAASEIVLGSFLHNLRVPFSGHILTALAIVILVAGHRSWPDRGLLVRAGLIAALMKSASPSAVLLGPMVAITMEGVIMELGVRFLGGGTWGYLLGGSVAMSWTLIQKILNLLLTYGVDLIRLYGDLIALAERQIGSVPLGPWGPIAALAALNVCLGASAALAGQRLGGRSGDATGPGAGGAGALPTEWSRRLGLGPGHTTRPSLLFLAFWVVVTPLGLAGIGTLPLSGKVLLAGGAVLIAAGRYGRALRRLGRPGFWIGLLVITMGTGAISGALSPENGQGWIGGLGIGAGMSLHAVFVTMCFAGLSTELAHPVIRRWMEGVGGGQLHGGIQAAFATLPLVVASLPPGEEFRRHPVQTLARLLPRLEDWLRALRDPVRGVGVVTGDKGQGKTTCVEEVVAGLRGRGVVVGGILAPGKLRDGRRWSIDLVDLCSGSRIPLASREPEATWQTLGSFWVNPEGLALGRQALSPEVARGVHLVVVDEVGPWELAGEGWSAALDILVGMGIPLLVVVRKDLVGEVMTRFGLLGLPVWDVAQSTPEEIADGAVSTLFNSDMERQ